MLPSSSLVHRVDVELIQDGIKYTCSVCKKGKSSYFTSMNESFVEAESHRLTDGGRLMSFNGCSYTTYLKEEVGSYRIVIDNQTCVFDKENDPSVLRYVFIAHVKEAVLQKVLDILEARVIALLSETCRNSR